MAFSDNWTTSQDAGFQQRCLMAAISVAEQYTNEQAETVPVDVKRRALAVAVLNDPDAYMKVFAYALAAANVITGDDDETINTMTFSLWDNIAGINTQDYVVPS